MKHRAVIYARLSREDEEKIDGSRESRSIENQVKILTDYAKKNNFEVIDVYIDDGYSGGNQDRPEFQRMMHDAKINKFNILLVKDISRLGRSFHQVGKLIDYDFPAMKIRVIAPGDNYDSKTYNDDESIVIRIYLNDMYLKDFKKKIRRSLIHRSKTKKMKSGPKYGYLDDENGNRIVDPIASKVIIRIFRDYVSGIPPKDIAKNLNEEGILTRASYVNKYLSKKYKHDQSVWTTNMIGDVIRDYEYCGHIINMQHSNIFEKVIIKDRQPKIIDEETYERANRIMSSRTVKYDNNKHLAKIIFDSNTNKHPAYSLSEKKPKYVFREGGYSVDAETVNNIVYKECLNTITECCSYTDKFYDLYRRKLFGTSCGDKQILEQELNSLNKAYERLLEDYFSEKITENAFENKADELQVSIRFKEEEINNYNTRVSKVKMFERKFFAFIEDIKELPQSDLELIKTCVSRIIIENKGGTRKRRNFTIKLIFKFEEID